MINVTCKITRYANVSFHKLFLCICMNISHWPPLQNKEKKIWKLYFCCDVCVLRAKMEFHNNKVKEEWFELLPIFYQAKHT